MCLRMNILVSKIFHWEKYVLYEVKSVVLGPGRSE